MSLLMKEIAKLQVMDKEQVYSIRQGNDLVYLYRSIDGYVIAIPYEEEKEYDESFVGIRLFTSYINFDNKSIRVLCLKMNENGDLKKFAYVGDEYIDINNRDELLENPYRWVDSWKDMFGDAKKKYLISDVLAELISLKYIFKKDKTAKWQGPKDGTHDIVCNNYVVEVKSTTLKTNTTIMINSAFQLNPSIKEYLFFVRLEKKPYAITINSIIKELVDMGYPDDELEEMLKLEGYGKNNRKRNEAYSILSIESYDVNKDTFPCINLQDINNITKSKNIIGFTLRIDLAGIEKTNLIIEE